MRIDRAADLRARLEGLIARDGLPGAVAAFVADGTIEVVAAGLADRAAQRPAAADTVFQAASLAKVLTGCALLRLAQAGTIDLDAPVQRFVSRYPLPPSRFDPDAVTVRRIMSHTAGLGVADYPGFEPDAMLPTLEASLGGAGGLTEALRIVAPPGAAFAYSGGGFTLLQMVVEEVTGIGFARFMRQTILEPLGMRASTFAFPRESRALAQPYAATGAPLPVYRYEAAAAAGLYTTAADLGRFLDAWMTGSAPLEAGSLIAMAEPRAETGGIDGLWSRYGLACEIGEFGETRVAGHHGVNRGWRAVMAAEIGGRRGVAVLVHSDAGTALAEEVAAAWFSPA